MKTYMKMMLFALGTALLAAQPDVTGKWQLDAGKSDFGNRTAPEGMTLTITQTKKLLRISQTSTNPGEERVIETECRTDGTFHPVDGPVGGSVKCKFEGNTLVGEKELPDGKGKLEMRLTVAADGQTATERMVITNSAGAGVSTLIWKRQ